MNHLLTPREWQRLAIAEAAALVGTAEYDAKMVEARRYEALANAIDGLEDQVAALRNLLDIPERQPPYGSIRKAAMAIYKPPFKYEHGYIFDSQRHMVTDNGGIGEDEPGVPGAVAARIRGWGRIGYMPDAAALQDEVGRITAEALTAYYAANR